MKILGKILALLVVGLGLLSVIAMFYKTQVSIPEKPHNSNSHVDYLREKSLSFVGLNVGDNISDMDSTSFMQDESLEELYHRQLLSHKRFYEEKLISETEYNCQLDTFVLCYSEAFIAQAHRLFCDRIWSAEDRTFLSKRVVELKALENLERRKVLDDHSDLQSRVDAVNSSCIDYAKASDILSHKTYSNITTSKSRIDEVEDILNRGTLNLNTGIVEDLRNYPSELGDSHFQFIKDLAGKIANWSDYSLSTTISRYDYLVSEADEYISNGERYKGEHPYSVSEIKNSALSNKNEAIDNLSTLYVDGYSSDFTKNIGNDSGYLTFSISTNHPDGYRITGASANWFSISSKNDNSVTISYRNNPTYETRSDFFNVEAGSKKIKVILNQDRSANNPTFNRGYIGGKSTVNWTSTHSGRITVSVSNNSGCDLDLTIIDNYGRILAEDKTSNHNPSVTFNSPGYYTIRIYNYTDRGCNYELRER